VVKTEMVLGVGTRRYRRTLRDRVGLAGSPGVKRSSEGKKVVVVRRRGCIGSDVGRNIVIERRRDRCESRMRMLCKV
jgi:hypothetical protein